MRPSDKSLQIVWPSSGAKMASHGLCKDTGTILAFIWTDREEMQRPTSIAGFLPEIQIKKLPSAYKKAQKLFQYTSMLVVQIYETVSIFQVFTWL